jgi:GINS complex subunit 4
MKQLLGQEKMAPELLPYQHALVETICALINSQDREIAAKTQMRANGQALSTDERFYMNILRMELERIKYLVKAYLRARILKIEKHLLFIVEKDQANLLSQPEMDYAWQLYESRKEHFKTELFDKISQKLNSMQDGRDIDNSMSKYQFLWRVPDCLLSVCVSNQAKSASVCVRALPDKETVPPGVRVHRHRD